MGSQSIALFALVVPHLLAGLFLGWRLMSATTRDELRGWFREDDGGDPRLFPKQPRPRGGGAMSRPPMPDADPSAVRLRDGTRLSDRRPAPPRRPAHPVQPERQPEPTRR